MSNPFTVTRRFTFCAGHRLLGHEGKCARPHGHNYAVEVEAVGDRDDEPLDPIGRVVDFDRLKEAMGSVLELLDHRFLLAENDHALRDAFEGAEREDDTNRNPDDRPSYVVVLDANPTAEVIARWIGERLVGSPVLVGCRVVRVAVQETENCRAEWRP